MSSPSLREPVFYGVQLLIKSWAISGELQYNPTIWFLGRNSSSETLISPFPLSPNPLTTPHQAHIQPDSSAALPWPLSVFSKKNPVLALGCYPSTFSISPFQLLAKKMDKVTYKGVLGHEGNGPMRIRSGRGWPNSAAMHEIKSRLSSSPSLEPMEKSLWGAWREVIWTFWLRAASITWLIPFGKFKQKWARSQSPKELELKSFPCSVSRKWPHPRAGEWFKGATRGPWRGRAA